MLYLMLIAFFGLVGWMLHAQGREQREQESLQEIYRTEYHHVYPTAN